MQFRQNGCGGLLFRADPVNYTSYYFEICQKQSPSKSTYGLIRWDSLTQPENILPFQVGDLYSILKSKHNTDLTNPVTLAVVVSGNNFELWVDGQELDVGFDLTARELKEGEIGVAATGNFVKGATLSNHYPQSQLAIVAFSNAKVWTFYGG